MTTTDAQTLRDIAALGYDAGRNAALDGEPNTIANPPSHLHGDSAEAWRNGWADGWADTYWTEVCDEVES